jgi:hypothetical protein
MHQLGLFVGGLVLATSTTWAQTSSPQTITYQAITANSPIGISRLRVTQVESNAYVIDFSIVAPNRTQHTGHIQGLATKDGSQLTLKVPNFQPDGNVEHPALCTLVIDVDDTHATVVSEHRCAGFGGAAASFVEQGRKLARVFQKNS